MGSCNTSRRRAQLGGADLPAAAASSSHGVMDVPYPTGWGGRRLQGRCTPSTQLFSRCTEPSLYEDFYLLMHGHSGRGRNSWMRLEYPRNPAVTRHGGTPARGELPACRIPHHLTHPRDPAAATGLGAVCGT